MPPARCSWPTRAPPSRRSPSGRGSGSAPSGRRLHPRQRDLPEVHRSGELTEAIIRRARRSGRLRPQIGTTDIGLILESCATIAHPDPTRTGELRRRMLGMIIDGLTVDSDLPGSPPGPGEYAYRWIPQA